MKKRNGLALSLVTVTILTACGGSSSSNRTTPSSTPSTLPSSTNHSTEEIVTIPKKPIVSNVPKSTIQDEVTIELTGEIGTTVLVNGEEVATIESEGKVEITLDTSGEKGSKTFKIVLKNAKGELSEALVILVEKEDAETATVTTSTYVPPVPILKEAVLIDAVIEGVSYRCGTKTGKTDENGTFACFTLPVIFFVADEKIEVGRLNSIPSDSKAFVQDLAGVSRDNFTDPKVLKLGSFFLALDDDGSFTNRITVDDSAFALTSTVKLDDMNLTSMKKLLTDNGLTPLNDDDVVNHLIENANDDVNKTVAKDRVDVFKDKESLTLGEEVDLLASLTLPLVGEKGSTYSYASNNESRLSSAGVVTRGSYSEGNSTVTMIVTISKGTVSETKEFTFNVVAEPIDDLTSVTLAKEDLSIEGTLSAIDGNIVLLTSGLHETTISWSSNSSFISTTGVVTRPTFTEGNQVIQLEATITKGSQSVTKTFDLTVLKLAISDAEIVTNVQTALSLGDTSALTSNLTLPTLIDGVSIAWSSSTDAISSTGVINPDNYEGVDKTATLIATLIKGDVTETKEFVVTVPKMLMTDVEAVALEKIDLVTDLIGGYDIDISGDLTLPLSVLDNGVTISWESNNSSIVSNSGVVNQPSYTSGTIEVILKAIFTKGSATDTKDFIIVVRALDMTGDEMIAEAVSGLTFDDIKNANSAEDNILTSLTLPDTIITSNGSNVRVVWESNNTTVIDNSGLVIQPSFTLGSQTIELKGILGISDGAGGFDATYTTQQVSFGLKVIALDMSDTEAVSLASDALDLGDTSAVTGDLTLLTLVEDTNVNISWESNNSAVLSNTGVVTAPTFVNGNTQVTLTATITRGDASETRTFEVTVVSEDAISADLNKQAVGVDLNPIVITDTGYTIELYTDATAPTATGQEVLSVYGNITSLSHVVVLEAHSAYAVGSKFQVLVKDANNNILNKSSVLTYGEGATDINFGTIATGAGG